jgi:hypothetical protein
MTRKVELVEMILNTLMVDMPEDEKLTFLTEVFILTDDIRHEIAYRQEGADNSRRDDIEEEVEDGSIIEGSGEKVEGGAINNKHAGKRSNEKSVIPDSASASEGA